MDSFQESSAMELEMPDPSLDNLVLISQSLFTWQKLQHRQRSVYFCVCVSLCNQDRLKTTSLKNILCCAVVRYSFQQVFNISGTHCYSNYSIYNNYSNYKCCLAPGGRPRLSIFVELYKWRGFTLHTTMRLNVAVHSTSRLMVDTVMYVTVLSIISITSITSIISNHI